MVELENDIPMPSEILSTAKENVEFKQKVEVKETFASISNSGVILDNWRHSKEKYDDAKKELDQAKGFVMQLLKGKFDVGTTRFSTDHFVLKSSMNKKYEVSTSNTAELNNVLMEVANTLGADVANKVITWKPSLNVKVYENLPDHLKAKLDQFLTLSYGTPTLSIEEL